MVEIVLKNNSLVIECKLKYFYALQQYPFLNLRFFENLNFTLTFFFLQIAVSTRLLAGLECEIEILRF